jgi:chlorophyll synthase
MLVAASLGPWVLWAGLFGSVLAWAYSAPPFRLKQNGWWGNAACGICYEGLAWVTGAAVMIGGALPDWRILALAGLYSAGAHGIMTLNDFKAVEGDRQMGINSLPVLLGVQGAARNACWVMALPQVIVVALLVTWGAPWYAAAVVGLMLAQGLLMRYFLASPTERALFYSGFGVPLFVSGMMVSAFALRALGAEAGSV